jgi:hypothetical protein
MAVKNEKFLARLQKALERVQDEIRGTAAHGRVASGLAAEGYAGGYRDALMDVEALLRGIRPADIRRYWVDGK